MLNAVELAKLNITRREFRADPFPTYAWLRAEAPVFRTVLPDKQPAWLITRYDDVVLTLKDEQGFTKDRLAAKTPEELKKLPWMPPMFAPLARTILDTDFEEHARLRGLIHLAFTPRRVEQMRARVQTLANELLDNAERRGGMELIHDYALQIPLTIISELLGIPAKDREQFHRWTKTLVNLGAAQHAQLLLLPQVLAMLRYLRRLFKQRRADPRDDLISALGTAEEDGRRLTDDELLAMVFVLLLAGHETTVNLIGSGALALLQNPDQLRLLRERPELNKSAIEELLRYVNPVEEATERYAREEVTLHGLTIPKGQMVLAVLASANRDEHVFSQPDQLDLARADNKHVAFGLGVHYCVGAPLARLEGQIALQTLAERLPGLRLAIAPHSLRWRPGLTVRGLEALPVAV
ncbi:MAG: cytochrome P450 [Anaerolineales bacterium]